MRGKYFFSNLTDRSFLFHFLVVFLVGSALLGGFENYLYTFIYDPQKEFWEQYQHIRFVIFLPAAIYFCGISYTFYSFFLLYQDICRVRFKGILKMFLLCYYVLFIWVLTSFHYTSPISYTVSYLFSGFKYGSWDKDLLEAIYDNTIRSKEVS